jgi:membrane associated rhomboid family serine protease
MGTLIPLRDETRRPVNFPIATTTIVIFNALVFIAELVNGDAFVTRWSVIPADIVAGRHWITILTAMFMHGS